MQNDKITYLFFLFKNLKNEQYISIIQGIHGDGDANCCCGD